MKIFNRLADQFSKVKPLPKGTHHMQAMLEDENTDPSLVRKRIKIFRSPAAWASTAAMRFTASTPFVANRVENFSACSKRSRSVRSRMTEVMSR